jgi:hypothetical protein
VMRLQRLRHQHGNTQDRIRSEFRRLTERIPDYQEFIENLKLDMQRRTDTRGEVFHIQLEKTTVKDRGIAGELLQRIIRRVSGEQRHFAVGSFAGFELSVRSSQWGRPEFILQGKNHYALDAVDTPLGMVRSLEYLAQNLERQLVEKQAELATAQKQHDELRDKIGQPFEYEDKLQSLVARQNELDKKLDLTKNQAACSLEAGETEIAIEQESESESVQSDIGQSPAEKMVRKPRLAMAR